LVLLFGVANDLLFPAILMVAAISTGMAIAMSGIGVLAILGRNFASRRFSGNGAAEARFAHFTRVGGAVLVLLIGCGLLALTLDAGGKRSPGDSLESALTTPEASVP
jgi:ABC-type nickel/cobalt efflux system permease component RcnA